MARLSRTENFWLQENMKPIAISKEEHNELFRRKLDWKTKARHYESPDKSVMKCIVRYNFIGTVFLALTFPFIALYTAGKAFVEYIGGIIHFFTVEGHFIDIGLTKTKK